MASKKNTDLINLHGNEYMALIQIMAIATYFEVGFQNEVYACSWDFAIDPLINSDLYIKTCSQNLKGYDYVFHFLLVFGEKAIWLKSKGCGPLS